ncbi:MAG: Trk system potassium transporter TrkA, partial [Thermoguttaceae bacterium]
HHEVTMVDNNPKKIQQIDAALDVTTITGSAAQSSILFQAGVSSADLCLAMTGNDECNMLAASMAKAMGASRVAARVYGKIFRDLSTFDYQHHFKIDRLLSLEHLTAMEFARRIREPGAMVIEHFARGEVEMQDVIVSRSSKATGVPLMQLRIPSEVRIGTINHEGNVAIATANDVIEVGDRISLIGTRDDVETVKKMFHTQPSSRKSVVIAGGGETGFHLAQVLENRGYRVTILDADRQRCDFLASRLKRSSICHSDARRKIDLEEERVGESDIFVSCLGEDEDNIMSCVEAQEIGVKTLMGVVSRPDYANVIGKLGITEAVSPREVMARQVVGLLNTGPIIFRNKHILGGGIDVLEIEVQPDSPITKDVLRNVKLPRQGIIGAMIREEFVQVPGAGDQLRAGDIVVALVQSTFVDEFVEAFDTE